jgi:transcriptional regulator with XRE-family HTH domain
MKKKPQTQAQIDAAFLANGGIPKTHTDKPKNPVGRPSDYDKLDLQFVEKCSKAGLSNEQTADLIGIHISTLYQYQKDYPEFSEALKAGKENPDDRIERALFERAAGYIAPEEKLFYDSNTGTIASQTILKQYPPDTAAAIIWLKNRRPEKWRENPVSDVAPTENNINITFVPVPKK